MNSIYIRRQLGHCKHIFESEDSLLHIKMLRLYLTLALVMTLCILSCDSSEDSDQLGEEGDLETNNEILANKEDEEEGVFFGWRYPDSGK